MANTKYVITRDSYTALIAGAATINVALPTTPYRVGRGDIVELIIATSEPTVPSNTSAPNELGVYLVNLVDHVSVIANLAVADGETLYARWMGLYDYGAADDLYVVTF